MLNASTQRVLCPCSSHLLDVSPHPLPIPLAVPCFSWPLLTISLHSFLSWPLPVLILRCSCPPQIHSLRIPLAQLVASHSPAHSPGHTYSHSHITILSAPLLLPLSIILAASVPWQRFLLLENCSNAHRYRARGAAQFKVYMLCGLCQSCAGHTWRMRDIGNSRSRSAGGEKRSTK